MSDKGMGGGEFEDIQLISLYAIGGGGGQE
jgi:hypothetical protein